MSTAQGRVDQRATPLVPDGRGEQPQLTGRHPLLRTGGVFLATGLVVLVLAAVYLTQGTAGLGLGDVVRSLLGLDEGSTA